MTPIKTPLFPLAALILLGAGGALSAQPGRRPAHTVDALAGLQKPKGKEEKAEDYLRAARLERETGNLKAAFGWCDRIQKEFPDNRKVTPRALLMGAELLLEMNQSGSARGWTTSAIRRFRDLPDYQKRMAVLHRYAIARLTYARRNRPRYHISQYCLILQWSVRGLSRKEIRERYDRFWEEVRRHLEDWERPGKEKGREGYPPSGMGRVMEWISAALARDALKARGKDVKALDELVPLLKRRIQALRGLWASPTPDPRALERFDGLMRQIWMKFMKFMRSTRSLVTFHIPRRPRGIHLPGEKEKPLSEMTKEELVEKVKDMSRRIEALEKEIQELKKNKERGKEKR